MKGAYAWTFHEIAFANHEGEVNLKPSQFFTSTWMSATAGTEWLCVDLGSCSTFDKINLHWINKAIKGKIQTSDNAKDWQDLAELPGEESRTDVLDVQGKARYVRILMEESANGQPYMLSEVEVMGRGGLVPQPAPMPAIADGEMTLSGGNWQVQRASEVKESGEVISTPDYPSDQWIVATVPGTVLGSYIKAGALPDLNYADNQLVSSESFFNSNFWYRNEFEVPQGFKGDCVTLNFDGINWKANVYLNGQKAGRPIS